MTLADETWCTVPTGGTVVLPVGSTEQHGPHLPLDTDTIIAVEIARRIARFLGDGAVTAPAMSYGSSGEHQDFAGTISIGTDVLAALVIEWARSATTWASRVIIVNGHGGNLDALAMAQELLAAEGRDVIICHCSVPGMDAHAGLAETSMMLAIDPERVDVHHLAAGNTEPLTDLLPQMRARGVRAVTPNGVVGDPTMAEAELGHRLLDQITQSIIATVRSR